LNLVGIITPGGRIPAAMPNTVTYEDGVPRVEATAAPAPSGSSERQWVGIADQA
jgi:hypothetical protein